MLLVVRCEYINALMNVYMFRSAGSRRSHDCSQTHSPLKFRDVGGEDLIVYVVEAELALLLLLNDVSSGELL